MGVSPGDVVGSIEYIYNNKVLARSDLKVADFEYASSPYTANQPTKPLITFPLSSFLILLGILVSICVILIIIIKRKHKKRFKHKKLKFSKTLK